MLQIFGQDKNSATSKIPAIDTWLRDQKEQRQNWGYVGCQQNKDFSMIFFNYRVSKKIVLFQEVLLYLYVYISGIACTVLLIC